MTNQSRYIVCFWLGGGGGGGGGGTWRGPLKSSLIKTGASGFVGADGVTITQFKDYESYLYCFNHNPAVYVLLQLPHLQDYRFQVHI